jgi:carbon storage regulator
MLVLSRRENERLFIGDNVVITIVRVAGGAVRLGIEAPGDIQVQREEVRCREKDSAAKLLARVA